MTEQRTSRLNSGTSQNMGLVLSLCSNLVLVVRIWRWWHFLHRTPKLKDNSALSPIGQYIASQRQRHVSIEKYLQEEDRFKEFLVGHDQADDKREEAFHKVEGWNRIWDSITHTENLPKVPYFSEYKDDILRENSKDRPSQVVCNRPNA